MVIVKAALKVGGVEVIGVCDVDSEHLNNSANELEKLQGNKPKNLRSRGSFRDERIGSHIFIGTPPHWHALQFIASLRKGLGYIL